MFEKEAAEMAEEWVKEHSGLVGSYKFVKYDYDSMQLAFLAGLNKANEWHYPSKGELPKCDEETQLIFYVNCHYEVCGEIKIRKRTVLGFYKKSFMNDDVKLFVEKSKGYEDEHLPKDVIAWKEIVLPKELV